MNSKFKKGVNQVRLVNKLTGGFSNDEDKGSKEPAEKPRKNPWPSLLKVEKEFHAVFHAIQNEKEELLMSKEKEEENMWDIVDLDDEAIEEYASNELLGQFLSNTVFQNWNPVCYSI
ncbi:Cation channel sperm-associated protein 4 [Desmophyllum pertusum]|uniref:Cation channel sperm-associated protein 4 n=1 Tax=Desmophyllum pertusum TaxID=174260 RepID=A0A9W9YLS3_9CNID|nr:Cation channel sperm-associated protein 4 [Desmophyllum pertusum]